MGKKKNPVSESTDKVEKLKSLNKMLLKEACERGKQVNSLTHSNASFELELTKLRSELERLSDNDFVIRSELERTIMSLFTAEQLSEDVYKQALEMQGVVHGKIKAAKAHFKNALERVCGENNELSGKERVLENECEVLRRVCEERDELNGKIIETELVLQIEREVLRRVCEERDELKGLVDCNVVVVRKRVKEDLFALRKRIRGRNRVKDSLFELRKRNREMEREIGELRAAYDGLVGERELMERIGYILRDKDSAEISCVKLEEDLTRTEEELRLVVGEVGAMQEARDAEVGKRCELENVVSELNNTVVSLQEGEQRLLLNVAELEDKCFKGEEKRRVMEKKIDRLLEERKCNEKSIVGLMDEQIMHEKKLQETLSQLHSMKCKLGHLGKQNIGLLEAKSVEVGKRCELENVVSELNETVLSLQEEEQRLLVNVEELEDKCVEGEEKRKVMQKKIYRLLEERKSNEKSIEGLMDEQIMLEKKLQETLIQLHNVKCKLEHLVKQNVGLLEAKRRLDCDVGLSQKQMAELKTVILRLEESKKVRESKVKSLESEVVNHACKLKHVEAERSKLENCLYEEKQNVATLKKLIENMEMKLEESIKDAGKVKAENGALLVKKIGLENQCESQKKEIASIKGTLDKAQNEFRKMKGNIELADAESKLIRNMLDHTHAFCLKGESESKDGDLSGKKTSCEEAKQCGMKFEMIKNAFEVKEAKVDSMRKQLEFLKNYVEEANKKNSLRNRR